MPPCCGELSSPRCRRKLGGSVETEERSLYMSGKKIAAIIAAAVVVLAAALIWILWPSHPYAYRVKLTDSAGQEISDLTKLQAGDTVYMSVELQKRGKDESFEAYGLELTATLKGLTYNGDGVGFTDAMAVTGKTQTVAETETVSFMFMDLNRDSISIDNPKEIGTCSFTVTEPENAKIEMTTALIYPWEHTKGYEIIQGK